MTEAEQLYWTMNQSRLGETYLCDGDLEMQLTDGRSGIVGEGKRDVERIGIGARATGKHVHAKGVVANGQPMLLGCGRRRGGR